MKEEFRTLHMASLKAERLQKAGFAVTLYQLGSKFIVKWESK